MSVTKGSYKITTDTNKKQVNLYVSGSAEADQVQHFISDYQKETQSITASTYSLIVDCLEMKVVSQDMVPKLLACFDLYGQTGFQEIQFQIKENAVLKMQLSRLVRQHGLKNAKVVQI